MGGTWVGLGWVRPAVLLSLIQPRCGQDAGFVLQAMGK